MPTRWLIAADDLTGAADCAIAFTKSGIPAAVIWGEGAADAPVISINIESRALAANEAAGSHLAALRRLWSPHTRLYKKIDSTIRGQPAAELAATIEFLKSKSAGALAIVCPAFPGTGRTTENGSVLVQGQPLENSPLWARDHTYATAHLPSLLAEAGLKTGSVPLATIRSGPEELDRHIRQALHDGMAALVCDAATEADLDIIAAATSPHAGSVFWVGSGGLAAALARLEEQRPASRIPAPPPVSSGILIAVGSLAEVSRSSARQLAAAENIRHVLIEPDIILAEDRAPLDRLAASVVDDLAAGQDILVEIALSATPDLSLGTKLMDNLATALRPAAGALGGVIATGGDTAVALLNHFGVTGIDLLEEIESGIPLGVSIGRIRVPVVTKAGAFGTEMTLSHCLQRIREIRAHTSQDASRTVLS